MIQVIMLLIEGLGSLLIRSESDIDRIERHIERREQRTRQRQTEEDQDAAAT